MNIFKTFLMIVLACAVPAGVAFAGMADDDGKPESNQPVEDTWITTKVKSSLLADSEVSGMDISVETTNGVVMLKGVVDSRAQLEKAVSIARGIEGVIEVNTRDLRVTRN